MKKDNFYYFKIAQIVSIPISVFVIVRNLLDIEDFNSASVSTIFLKGLVVGIVTAVILGLINIFIKIDTFRSKANN